MNNQISKIAKLIQSTDFEYYGLRQIPFDQNPAIGSVLEASCQWVNEEPTDYKLDGTSAMHINTDLDRLEMGIVESAKKLGFTACEILGVDTRGIFHCYEGTRLALCGSEFASSPDDDGEMILCDAIVLDVM